MLLYSFNQFYASLDKSVQQEMLLYDYWWQKLHFEFSRQNLNKNVRVPPCGDGSSHSQSQSGKRLLLAFRGHPMSNQGYCRTQGNLLFQPQPLDLTPEAPFLILFLTIRLLINDVCTLGEKIRFYRLTSVKPVNKRLVILLLFWTHETCKT